LALHGPRFGRLPWGEVLRPAIRYANDGIPAFIRSGPPPPQAVAGVAGGARTPGPPTPPGDPPSPARSGRHGSPCLDEGDGSTPVSSATGAEGSAAVTNVSADVEAIRRLGRRPILESGTARCGPAPRTRRGTSTPWPALGSVRPATSGRSRRRCLRPPGPSRRPAGAFDRDYVRARLTTAPRSRRPSAWPPAGRPSTPARAAALGGRGATADNLSCARFDSDRRRRLPHSVQRPGLRMRTSPSRDGIFLHDREGIGFNLENGHRRVRATPPARPTLSPALVTNRTVRFTWSSEPWAAPLSRRSCCRLTRLFGNRERSATRWRRPGGPSGGQRSGRFRT